jgi:hypothetical protein
VNGSCGPSKNSLSEEGGRKSKKETRRERERERERELREMRKSRGLQNRDFFPPSFLHHPTPNVSTNYLFFF